MILIVHAHPYPSRSRGCAALLKGIAGVAGTETRSLYELYPDFDIDVAAELAALERARLVVWLAPLYWYSVPALLKHWLDRVLTGALDLQPDRPLAGRDCLWVATTGGGEYRRGARHDHPFSDFVPALEMAARYCGMGWLEPFVVHDAHGIGEAQLGRRAAELRARLEAFARGPA